jgi:VWFA-related protein
MRYSCPSPALRVLAVFAALASAVLAFDTALFAVPRAPAHGQAPAASTTSAPLPLVPVNVRVIDRAGKPVTDLQASDFTITEDNVAQPIKHFSVQTLTTDAAQPGGKLAARKGMWLSPQPYRIFVILLGRGRLEDASNAVTALAQFVRTRLVPQDQVAVFAYDRASPFTTDHEKVGQLLDRFKRTHADIDTDIGLQLGPTSMAGLYGRKAIPAKLQAKIDAMIDGPGARTPAGITTDVLDPKAFSELSLDEFMFSTSQMLEDQGNLVCLMEYLRRFDGEKHVLYVTEKGMQMPSEQADARVGALASDGRVVIHTIQAGGMEQPELGKEMEATLLRKLSFQSLRTMAGLTGGLAIFGEKGPAAVSRIDDVTKTSYLIGYQPRAGSMYRKIAVRVNKPDLTVLYRSGYYPAGDAEAFSRRQQITQDRLLAAGVFRRQVNDIRLKVSASQSGGQLKVDVKIDPTRLGLAVSDGVRTASLQAAVFSLDSAGNSLAADQQELTVRMTEDEFKRYQKDGIPYTLQFPLTRGTDNIRFIVYDYGADLIGRADTRVF